MKDEERRKYAFETLCFLHSVSVGLKVLWGNMEYDGDDKEMAKAIEKAKEIQHALERAQPPVVLTWPV